MQPPVHSMHHDHRGGDGASSAASAGAARARRGCACVWRACPRPRDMAGSVTRLRGIVQHVGTSSSALSASQPPGLVKGGTEADTVTGAALRAKLGAYEGSGQAEGKGISAGIGVSADGVRSSRYGLSTRDNTPVPETNSFGVSTVIPGLGILPRKVRTAAEAAERVRSDGAVILTGLSSAIEGGDAFFDVASSLPQEIFGEELLAATPPVSVGIPHKSNAAEMREYYTENWGKEIQSALPPWEPNCAHTDGEAYGDRFPPYLFLLFAHQSEDGGENALVDSHGLVDAMARDQGLAPTVDRLLAVPVDQTQYGPDDSGLNQLGQTCVAPVVQDIQIVAADGVTTKKRRMVKMATGSTRVASAVQKVASKAATALDEPTVDTSGWDVSENLDGDAEMIATFKDAVFAASAHAPRFKVLAGEALIVDNYRAMHIREAYSDMDRFSWRVWMWVDGDCLGRPADVMQGVQHYKARGSGDKAAA